MFGIVGKIVTVVFLKCLSFKCFNIYYIIFKFILHVLAKICHFKHVIMNTLNQIYNFTIFSIWILALVNK